MNTFTKAQMDDVFATAVKVKSAGSTPTLMISRDTHAILEAMFKFEGRDRRRIKREVRRALEATRRGVLANQR